MIDKKILKKCRSTTKKTKSLKKKRFIIFKKPEVAPLILLQHKSLIVNVSARIQASNMYIDLTKLRSGFRLLKLL